MGRETPELSIRLHRLVWLAALAVLAALLSPAPRAMAQEGANLPALAAMGADVTALVVRFDEQGRAFRVAAMNPDQPLSPASVSKLFVAADALRVYGAGYEFSTPLYGTGPVVNGVLQGDLIYVASGDPSITQGDLGRIAELLRATGVQRVAGNLRINQLRFGPLDCEIKDRCQALRRSAHAYDAPLAAAISDFGTVAVVVTPGAAAGLPATVSMLPFGIPAVRMDTAVTTHASKLALNAGRITADGIDTISVSGSIPDGAAPFIFHRAISNPPLVLGQILQGYLTRSGIQLDGGTVVEDGPVPGAARQLLAFSGQRLSLTLADMLRFSNNAMADVLTLDLAADLHPGQRHSLAGAALRLGETVLGPGDGKDPMLASGSGLSPESRVSAAALIALLHGMYLDTASFPDFYAGLEVPLSARGRTIRRGSTDWRTRVAGKTGWLSEPRSVFGFAGYWRTRGGGFGAFAFLVNSRKGKPFGRGHAFDAVRADLSAILQQY